jgi:hypothetical protein
MNNISLPQNLTNLTNLTNSTINQVLSITNITVSIIYDTPVITTPINISNNTVINSMISPTYSLKPEANVSERNLQSKNEILKTNNLLINYGIIFILIFSILITSLIFYYRIKKNKIEKNDDRYILPSMNYESRSPKSPNKTQKGYFNLY